jgi:hypothetical protein
MRHYGIERTGHASRDEDGFFAPDSERAQGNEVFQVLWEIGIHLAAFLGIAFVLNLIVVLLGAPPAAP